MRLQLKTFIKGIISDIYKLLPMREGKDKGEDNHLAEFTNSILMNLEGAYEEYPELKNKTRYIYVVNYIRFLISYNVEFTAYRKLVLDSVRYLSDLIDN